MIEPALVDEAFLGSVRESVRNATGVRLWWLGQSGFLLQAGGNHLLLDPYLSDSLTRKYDETDKPHVRISRRVVAPERLDFVDVVTSSHNHTDHLDGETLSALLRVNPKLTVVVPAANIEFAAARLDVPSERLTPIDDGQWITVAGFALAAVPAAHEMVERDPEGRCRYLGYVVRCGTKTIYHSGDTMLFEGMVKRLASLGPFDAVLLPINGRRPERRVAGNLWGREAARLARELGAGIAIPCHYDMFAFNTESPEEFQSEARRIGQAVRVLQLGGRLEL